MSITQFFESCKNTWKKTCRKMFLTEGGGAKDFEIGPRTAANQAGDLRQNRPYFLVPLDHPAKWPMVISSITASLNAQGIGSAQQPNLTDVYILSHGWHRSFFAAVEAYDKVISRFSVLIHRQLWTTPPNYNSIFLTLHWHSDPGEDGWEDPKGLRDKEDFMQRVERVFERPPTITQPPPAAVMPPPTQRFTSIFENIFELLYRMSSPGVKALSDTDIQNKSRTLAGYLAGCTLRDAPQAKLEEKIAAVWTCYFSTTAKRVLLDQNEPPHRFNDPLKAISVLLKFAVPIIGVNALLTFLLGKQQWLRIYVADPITQHLLVPLLNLLERMGIPIRLWESDLWTWASDFWTYAGENWIHLGVLLLSLLSVAFVILFFTALWNQRETSAHSHEHRSKHFPLPALLAWLPLQLILVAPAVLWALVTFLIGGPLMWLYTYIMWLFKRKAARGWLFDEKYPNGARSRKPFAYAYWLATLARLPLRWLRVAIAKDSPFYGLASAIDNQLAFWEMQMLGAESGKAAGEFVELLLTNESRLHDARLHFIGHSFGGLVVSNAVRYLALKQAAQPQNVPAHLHTLCLLQGAIASSWFEHEDDILSQMTGSIACIYSAYDTANGFYYPMANSARVAAGFIGLNSIGGVTPYAMGKPGLFASLVEPPDLGGKLTQIGATRRANCAWPLNLDASRVIYEGPIASGGGHDDIFKDEVIHLLWAITSL